MRCFLFLIFLLAAFVAEAQEIQNGLSYRDLLSPHTFRVNYENDFTFHTDYYYTQGVHFELTSPALNTRFIRALFLHLSDTHLPRRYGIGLESAGYTPMSITADSILYGDRPFAGMAYGKLFLIDIRKGLHPARLTTTLCLGWMGPAAGGYEIQAYIHRHTGNPDPAGWKYQVGNAPILNYEVDYERLLTPVSSYFQISAWGMARVGTLSTKASVGGIIIGGFCQQAFTGRAEKRYAYAYLHPALDMVAYDATLQGSLFTDENPYTINSRNVQRLLLRLRAGLEAGYKSFSLGFSMRYLTKEFRTGREHLTGGVNIAYRW